MQGRTMPSKPAHAASHNGYPVTVNVAAPNLAVKQGICMKSNSYVGQLRQQLAAKHLVDTQPEKLRMFVGGVPLLYLALSALVHCCVALYALTA